MKILLAVITLTALWAWAVAHQIAVYYIFAVMIDQLPKPSGNNAFYAWFFGVVQVFAANWNRAKMGVQTTTGGGNATKA